MLHDVRKHSTAVEAAVSAPPVAAVVAGAAGISPETWLTYLGIVVLALQAVWWLGRLWRSFRHEVERQRRGLPPPETET